MQGKIPFFTCVEILGLLLDTVGNTYIYGMTVSHYITVVIINK